MSVYSGKTYKLSPIVQAWIDSPPVPYNPEHYTVPEQASKTKKPRRKENIDPTCCDHEYIVVDSTTCPNKGCGKPDFRKLKCKFCGHPQSDTGTCTCYS